MTGQTTQSAARSTAAPTSGAATSATAAESGPPPWLEARRLEIKGLSLDDYVGAGYAHEEAAAIIARLRFRGEVAAVGVRPPRAMLVTGPVGVGKTHLARVIAAELSQDSEAIDVYEVNAGELTSERLGELATALGSSGRLAVVVVDEVDYFGRARLPGRGGSSDPETQRVLVTLLGLMDGLGQLDNVFWIFATSTPEVFLDPALRRPGRIDITITLDLPDEQDRVDLVRYCLRYVPLDQDLEPEEVARAVGLATPARIQSLIGDAYAIARAAGSTALGRAHVEAALERGGRATRDPVPDETALRRLAIHEAAHALVGLALGQPPDQLRLDQESGVTSFEARYRRRRQAGIPDREVRDRIAISLAGAVAEHEILGEGSLGSESDLKSATAFAMARLLNGCDPTVLISLPDRTGSAELTPEQRVGIEATLQEEWARAADLVRRLRPRIEQLAERLTAERRLEGPDLQAMLAEALGAETVVTEDEAA